MSLLSLVFLCFVVQRYIIKYDSSLNKFRFHAVRVKVKVAIFKKKLCHYSGAFIIPPAFMPRGI